MAQQHQSSDADAGHSHEAAPLGQMGIDCSLGSHSQGTPAASIPEQPPQMETLPNIPPLPSDLVIEDRYAEC